jgi:hypothetical protein
MPIELLLPQPVVRDEYSRLGCSTGGVPTALAEARAVSGWRINASQANCNVSGNFRDY